MLQIFIKTLTIDNESNIVCLKAFWKRERVCEFDIIIKECLCTFSYLQ